MPKRKNRKKLSRKSQNLNLSVRQLGQGVEVLVGENQAVVDNQVVGVGVHLGVEVVGAHLEVEVPEVEVVVLGVVPVGEAEAVEVVEGKEESYKIPTPGKEILTGTYHLKPASTSPWWMRSPITRPKSKPKFKTSPGK